MTFDDVLDTHLKAIQTKDFEAFLTTVPQQGELTLLLANGIDPNAVYNNDLTALMWAAGFGKTDTVRALLAAGAKPQLKDDRGKTAADMAREQKFAETAQLLDGAKTAN